MILAIGPKISNFHRMDAVKQSNARKVIEELTKDKSFYVLPEDELMYEYSQKCITPFSPEEVNIIKSLNMKLFDDYYQRLDSAKCSKVDLSSVTGKETDDDMKWFKQQERIINKKFELGIKETIKLFDLVLYFKMSTKDGNLIELNPKECGKCSAIIDLNSGIDRYYIYDFEVSKEEFNVYCEGL